MRDALLVITGMAFGAGVVYFVMSIHIAKLRLLFEKERKITADLLSAINVATGGRALAEYSDEQLRNAGIL